MPAMLVYTWNSRTWKVEAGVVEVKASLWVAGDTV